MIRETVQTDNAPKAIGPYAQAIKANGFLYTAGQIPIDPKTGNFVEGDISAQTRQVLENLKAVLEAGGSSFDRVVKALWPKLVHPSNIGNAIVAPRPRSTVRRDRNLFVMNELILRLP